MSEDFYAILGVDERATQAEVKQAYRNLARKYHPDRNQGDQAATDRFKDAAEAYRVLGDDELRAQYDDFRAGGNKSKIAPAATEAAGDVLNDLFGTSRNKQRGPKRETSSDRSRSRPRTRERANFDPAERGEDLRYDLEIDFEDAVNGAEHIVYVPSPARCRACAGTGAEPGTTPTLCQRCGGRGSVREQQGFFETARRCPDCAGAGKISPYACSSCEGSGVVEVDRSVTVDIPAGVETGTRLRIRGSGRPGANDGPPGDLVVAITVRPHPFFEREGQDLLVEVPITMTMAALGGHVEIPTLDGPMRMRVPEGSQSGRVFRLQGKGLMGSDGRTRGDQRVRVVVLTPTHLTDQMKRLLEDLADLEEEFDDVDEVRDFKHQMERYYRRRR